MDPVKFFSRFLDTPELIFQHSSGRELLELSEVNPNWCDFIGSTRKLIAKVKLVVKCDCELSVQDCELINNSSRRYQNLEIRCRDGYCNHRLIRPRIMKFVRKSSHKWKDVTVSKINFSGPREICDFLLAIEPTTESLALNDVEIETGYFDGTSSNYIFSQLKFPMLKKIKLKINNSVSSKILMAMLSYCRGVEELDDNMVLTHDSVDAELWFKMLQKLGKLKTLTLYNGNLYGIFNNNSWKRFQFKLKSFTLLQSVISSGWNETKQEKIFDFLASQSKSLEQLTLNHSITVEMFKIIMKMPRLRRLSLNEAPYLPPYNYYNLVPVNWEMIDTEKSSSIVDLQFSGQNDNSAAFITFLLEATPNVQTLSVDETMMKYLVTSKKNFEQV